MSRYIFMEKHGTHIIDLRYTLRQLQTACHFARALARNDKKILFVGTKPQACDVIHRTALRLHMPYVTERWLGGMLTNFATIRRAMQRIQYMEKLMKDTNYNNMAKRERLMLRRDKEKRKRLLGGISTLSRHPDALFIVDIGQEHIALSEARRLNIPVMAMVDTNRNPDSVDFPIAANDDSVSAISLITGYLSQAIEAGQAERKAHLDQSSQEAPAQSPPTSEGKGVQLRPRRGTEASSAERKDVAVSDAEASAASHAQVSAKKAPNAPAKEQVAAPSEGATTDKAPVKEAVKPKADVKNEQSKESAKPKKAKPAEGRAARRPNKASKGA